MLDNPAILGGAIAIGFIHVLAAVIAVGGGFFINFVLSRATADMPPPEVGKLNGAVGRSFTPVSLTAMILLGVTGLMRALGVKALRPDVLFGTLYGNLLLGKIIILAVIFVIVAMIVRTGAGLAAMAQGGPPPADVAAAAQRRISNLGWAAVTLGAIAILFAVALRFIGAPG